MIKKCFSFMSFVGLVLIITILSATDYAWSDTNAQPCVNPGKIFLSDQLNVYHQLELLQKMLYEREGAPPRVCPGSDEYKAAMLRVCKEFPSAQAGFASVSECLAFFNERLLSMEKIPTRYEDLGYFFLLKELAKEIETAAKITHHNIRSSLSIGTLPARYVNAAYLRFPGASEPLVLFSSEFFIFANAMSKAVVALLEIRHEGDRVALKADKKRARELLEQNPVIAEQLAEMLAEVLHVRNRWRHYYLADDQATIYGWLQNGMELFTMGHEYAHAYLKHEAVTIRPFSAIPSVRGDKTAVPDELVYSWSQEFMADYHGFKLFLKALDLWGDYRGISQWSADFFFTCVELLERAQMVFKTGEHGSYSEITPRDAAMVREIYEQIRQGKKAEEISKKIKFKYNGEVSTHPPAAYRRTLIRLAMREQGILDQEVDFGNRLKEISEILWESSLPILKQIIAKSKGIERKDMQTPQVKDEVLIQVSLKHNDDGYVLVWVDGVYYGMTKPGTNEVIVNEKLLADNDPRLQEALAVLMAFQLDLDEIPTDEAGIVQLVKKFRRWKKESKVLDK